MHPKPINTPGRGQTSVWPRPVYWYLLILSVSSCLNVGCAAAKSIPPAQLPPAPVAADQVVIVFEEIDCGCSLGDVDAAILRLPGVGRVRWNVDARTATLFFLDDQRPTDAALRDIAETYNLAIDSIIRPAGK